MQFSGIKKSVCCLVLHFACLLFHLILLNNFFLHKYNTRSKLYRKLLIFSFNPKQLTKGLPISIKHPSGFGCRCAVKLLQWQLRVVNNYSPKWSSIYANFIDTRARKCLSKYHAGPKINLFLSIYRKWSEVKFFTRNFVSSVAQGYNTCQSLPNCAGAWEKHNVPVWYILIWVNISTEVDKK